MLFLSHEWDIDCCSQLSFFFSPPVRKPVGEFTLSDIIVKVSSHPKRAIHSFIFKQVSDCTLVFINIQVNVSFLHFYIAHVIKHVNVWIPFILNFLYQNIRLFLSHKREWLGELDEEVDNNGLTDFLGAKEEHPWDVRIVIAIRRGIDELVDCEILTCNLDWCVQEQGVDMQTHCFLVDNQLAMSLERLVKAAKGIS